MFSLNGGSVYSLWPPFANFTVTSPTLVDRPVTYRDQSWDPAPTHHIIFETWVGRRAIFTNPGRYTVTLWVEDDRGLWSACTRQVVVFRLNPTPGPSPSGGRRPPPPTPHLRLSLSNSTVPRGGQVSLTLHGPQDLQGLHTVLPKVMERVEHAGNTTLDYRKANAKPWQYRSGSWHTTLFVPWSRAHPGDGTYRITASGRWHGHTLQASVSLKVRGTLQYIEALPALTSTG